MRLLRILFSDSDHLIRFFFTVSAILVLLSFVYKPLLNCTLHGKQLKTFYCRVRRHLLVPKACFSNYYLLGLILNLLLFYYERLDVTNLYRVMFITHLVRRLFEQIFMFSKLARPSSMHIMAYLFGLVYYVVTAFSLTYPETYYPFKYSVLLNIFAQLLQFYSHLKLSELRRDVREDVPLYKIPRAGPFKYVLAPHYAAEILIYVSICCNMNMVFCLAFTTIELATLAYNNKQWYTERFTKDKLVTTKALIPYVF